MARTKRGRLRQSKRRKVLEETRGHRGQKRTSYRRAKEQLLKSRTYAYRDRKTRKREFRRLWIMRINAGARANGLSYSQLMHGLKTADIDVNRKMLADMAVNEPDTFAEIAARAKQALNAS